MADLLSHARIDQSAETLESPVSPTPVTLSCLKLFTAHPLVGAGTGEEKVTVPDASSADAGAATPTETARMRRLRTDTVVLPE